MFLMHMPLVLMSRKAVHLNLHPRSAKLREDFIDADGRTVAIPANADLEDALEPPVDVKYTGRPIEYRNVSMMKLFAGGCEVAPKVWRAYGEVAVVTVSPKRVLKPIAGGDAYELASHQFVRLHAVYGLHCEKKTLNSVRINDEEPWVSVLERLFPDVIERARVAEVRVIAINRAGRRGGPGDAVGGLGLSGQFLGSEA
jgi:hypothetical protein